jgi:hypothetical protein
MDLLHPPSPRLRTLDAKRPSRARLRHALGEDFPHGLRRRNLIGNHIDRGDRLIAKRDKPDDGA